MHAGDLPAGRARRVLGLPVLGLPMLPALPSMRLCLASLPGTWCCQSAVRAIDQDAPPEAAQAPANAKTSQAVQLQLSWNPSRLKTS
jgi:hypothetical protein